MESLGGYLLTVTGYTIFLVVMGHYVTGADLFEAVVVPYGFFVVVSMLAAMYIAVTGPSVLE